MSKVHNAMRQLEHKSAPATSAGALSHLIDDLLQELADELPDDPKLDPVRADLLVASRSYETCHKKDLALRFYLAMRGLLREHEVLRERIRKAERNIQFQDSEAEVLSHAV